MIELAMLAVCAVVLGVLAWKAAPRVLLALALTARYRRRWLEAVKLIEAGETERERARVRARRLDTAIHLEHDRNRQLQLDNQRAAQLVEEIAEQDNRRHHQLQDTAAELEVARHAIVEIAVESAAARGLKGAELADAAAELAESAVDAAREKVYREIA